MASEIMMLLTAKVRSGTEKREINCGSYTLKFQQAWAEVHLGNKSTGMFQRPVNSSCLFSRRAPSPYSLTKYEWTSWVYLVGMLNS